MAMAANLYLIAAVLLTATPYISGQNEGHDCSYMTAIPRPQRPDDWPEFNFDGTTWPTRPLLPAPDRLDLCMDQYYPGGANSGTQLIFMEEEIEGDIAIAKLNYQDYEEGMVSYSFNVRVEGQTLVPLVSLTIVNIDDNFPWLHILDPCQTEISTTAMTFEIISDRGDEQIFYIRAENVPGDWFSMKITSRPPRWTEIFAVQQFNEKTEMEFRVQAIDGDTAINKAIHYDIITEEGEEGFFSITTIAGGHSGGILHVAPIDRDHLQREVFRFTIIAYKYDNREEFSTEAPIVIIINDINDQRPEPIQEEYRISMLEETPLTLDFGEQIFGFHDRDLGENAQYTVELETVSPPGVAAAFYVAPQVGYQYQTFIMGTVDHAMLDYEVEEFQHIVIRAVATDMNNSTLQGEAMLYIELINWNDEEPIFEEDAYFVSFNETEGADFYVATVLAEDRDVDDEVVHSLMGNAGEYLSINSSTGEIRVSIDDAFDYHRQNELFVQVRAVDTLGDERHHTVTTQLVIQLKDINNTPPSLRLPRGSPSVEENVPEGEVITTMITATDPDTTAYLRFEIGWETSYATKQGRETPVAEFHDCVEIVTVHDEGNTGSAHGHLIVKEIRDNVTIDFEEFEVLYITVRVVDEMTEIGQNFDEKTLSTEFRVRENSTSNVVIGSVLATDIDGPLYNQIRYSIVPTRGTPDNLVQIHPVTGQITTNLEHAIDADIPPREYLYYTVIASDRCEEEDRENCPDDPTYWETPGDISIYIIDTNNKLPQAEYDQFPTEVRIYEDAGDGTEVVRLVASDLDRDDIYHTVRYQINYVIDPDLRRFFAVDVDTGLIYIEFTTGAVLDRGPSKHRGDGGTGHPSRRERQRASVAIHATDRDERFTNNSRVSYEVVDIRAVDRDIEVPILFDIETIPDLAAWEFYGALFTTMDLRGYWGTYEIRVRAYDHGDPMLDSFEWYEVEIAPYNFHNPRSANGPLVTVGDAFLENLHATDEDGLHAGVVDFSVSGNVDAIEYFEVENLGENSGQLRLRSTFDEYVREFQVTIRATDRGTVPGPLWTDTILNVIFVPSLVDPTFTQSTDTVAFFEQEVDGERHQLSLAEDLKNHGCTDDCYPIYYRIVREANPRPTFVRELYTAGISTLDVIGRELLVVQATHSENAAITYSIDYSSMQVDASLEAVRDVAFSLHATSGALTLGIQPTAAMHGMFEFDVIAEDAETFSTGFSMTCNIDQVLPATNSAGVAQTDRTEVRAHFIRADVPVPATEIEVLRDDTQLLFTIQMALRDRDLQLSDFVTDLSPEESSDASLITIYVLAALSAVLAFLCLLLLITFFIRTRALNRRLEALSMTKYGSVDSGLNRAGLAAPGTNKGVIPNHSNNFGFNTSPFSSDFTDRQFKRN
ncbi:hypothetical protein MSG28_008267 [Choristoneura fumiferana]|uniref:Uncharacterized protein n=1 Tax=Choristoneura fumiferana TaxID=7141 RepID=A0ACC0JAR5_CHOFU|nr:hypothetical protein MSG28_008267 [Choristoneura fumiferana]